VTPKTQTFKSSAAALANAKKLFAAGEINEADFKATAKKLMEADLSAWMKANYPDRKS
jgi:hypothetical protein